VAAFVDGESVVRSYVLQGGQPFLKAAHPEKSDLVAAQELVIQGTLVRLTRNCR
jgi:SOS-response transcriptional repressor LexA